MRKSNNLASFDVETIALEILASVINKANESKQNFQENETKIEEYLEDRLKEFEPETALKILEIGANLLNKERTLKLCK